MDYYQEITLLPDLEVPPAFLWTKVFSQLHIAFADEKNRNGRNPYAVSFPEYGEEGLGEKIRIFAEEEELERLNLPKVLARFMDYVHYKSIRKVPRIKRYAVYSRYQPEAALWRKAKRYAKRHPETDIEKAKQLLKTKKESEKWPYIQMKSLSNGENFSLFIKKRIEEKPVEAEIGTYGLSNLGTVPEF